MQEERKVETICPHFSSLIIINVLVILKKNLYRTTLRCILKNFRMCTIVIEDLKPLDRASPIKLYKNNFRSRQICRIAKRSIDGKVYSSSTVLSVQLLYFRSKVSV